MENNPAKKTRPFKEGISMYQDFALDPSAKEFIFSSTSSSSPTAPPVEKILQPEAPTGSPVVGETTASGSKPRGPAPSPQPLIHTNDKNLPDPVNPIAADTNLQNISKTGTPVELIEPTPMDNEEDFDDSAAVINNAVSFAAATTYLSVVRSNKTRAQIINRFNEYGVTHFNGRFIRCGIFGSGENRRLVMHFNELSARSEFCAFDHTTLALPDQEAPTFHEHDPRQIAASLRTRQLNVNDIPLDIAPNVVRASFQKYGNISGFKMTTRPGALFQTAIITFDSPDSVSSLAPKWCTWVQGACLRIHPAITTAEELKGRTANSTVLVGLPPGIRAIDLGAISSDTNARAIGLPRHAKSYKNKPWAYFDFASEEDRDAALEVSSAITFRNCMHYLR